MSIPGGGSFHPVGFLRPGQSTLKQRLKRNAEAYEARGKTIPARFEAPLVRVNRRERMQRERDAETWIETVKARKAKAKP